MIPRRLAALVLLAVASGCGGHGSATPADPGAPRTIAVSSPAFADGARIPVRYTCRGEGSAPEIRWSGLPADAGSLALAVDDPDAPGGDYVHWLVLGIPAGSSSLDPGSIPSEAKELDASGGPGWSPPCPPSGTHHYRFTVYAFAADETFAIQGETSPEQVMRALADQAIGWGRVTGTVSAR